MLQFTIVMLEIARSHVTQGGQIACYGGSRNECEQLSFGFPLMQSADKCFSGPVKLSIAC